MTAEKGDQSHTRQFFVVPFSNGQTLLGLKSCQKLDILRLNAIEIEKASILEQYNDVFTGLGKVEGHFRC